MPKKPNMTSEEIGKLLDEALGPDSPFATPEEIALHKHRREQGISMQTFLANERTKVVEKALAEKVKPFFAKNRVERQGGGQ